MNTRSKTVGGKAKFEELKNDKKEVKQVKKVTVKKSSDKMNVEKESTSKETRIHVGDTVTFDEELKDANDQAIKFSDLFNKNKNGIILFTYPRANTPGCTKQACGFNANLDAIQEKDYKVFALGGDSPSSLTKWKEKYSLKYELISDPNLKLIKYLGFSKNKKIIRSHVVIDKDGKVLSIASPISPADSFSQAMNTIGVSKDLQKL